MLCVDFQNLQGCHQEEQPKLFTALRDERTECNGLKLKRDAQTSYKEKLVSREDRQAVEQVSQRGCSVFVLGDFQDMTEQSPEKLGLTSELTLI